MLATNRVILNSINQKSDYFCRIALAITFGLESVDTIICKARCLRITSLLNYNDNSDYDGYYGQNANDDPDNQANVFAR